MPDLHRQPSHGNKCAQAARGVHRWPHAAQEQGVSLAVGAQELPTLVLFERGKAVKRLSAPTGSVLKGGLTAQDCQKRFQLDQY